MTFFLKKKKKMTDGFGAAPKHPNFPIAAGAGSTWGTHMPFGSPAFPGAPTWGAGTGK